MPRAGEASAMPNAANVVAATAMENVDWRTDLQADSRQRIVNKILDTLKRHLPFSGQEGLQELNKTAVRLEEKIYSAATSQSDYLIKISLKMLTMEMKLQNPMANSNTSKNLPDPDSTAQTGNASGGDWQEEVYQKIKSMKEMYFDELTEMYEKIATKLQQNETLPQQAKNDQLEKLKLFKLMLEHFVQFLQLNKNDIQVAHREKLGSIEKQIISIFNSNRHRKPTPM